jgi:hypothetical protein
MLKWHPRRDGKQFRIREAISSFVRFNRRVKMRGKRALHGRERDSDLFFYSRRVMRGMRLSISRHSGTLIV